MTTVVCAGNYRQFVDWCRSNDLDPRDSRQAIYANVNSIRRLSTPVKVAVVGTWPDTRTLAEVGDIRCALKGLKDRGLLELT